MPPVIGGLAGFIAITLVPGVSTWTLGGRLGLFFAVAIPVALAELVFARWYGRFLVAHLELAARRVAIVAGTLKVERTSGGIVDYPLELVHVSDAPTSGDWYVVRVLSGRASVTFYVPGPVAAALRGAPGGQPALVVS